MSEIARKISEATTIVVDGSTVCRVLHQHRFLQRKILQVAKRKCMEYPAQFMVEVFNYRKEMFTFVDEAGSDERDCLSTLSDVSLLFIIVG